MGRFSELEKMGTGDELTLIFGLQIVPNITTTFRNCYPTRVTILKLRFCVTEDPSPAASSISWPSLPDEPSPSDPDATRVAFRLPDGQRQQRRFRKSDSLAVSRPDVSGLFVPHVAHGHGQTCFADSYAFVGFNRRPSLLLSVCFFACPRGFRHCWGRRVEDCDVMLVERSFYVKDRILSS